MFHGASSFLNFAGLLALLVWPSQRCPDLVCADPPVVERVPAAVEKTLDFALASLEACKPQKSGDTSWYSLFWLGFVCGAAAVLVLLLVLRSVYTAFLAPASPAAAPQQPPVFATAESPRQALPSQVHEPANRHTLRELGLLR